MPRLLFAVVLLFVVGGPSLAAVGQLVREPAGWAAWTEADRLLPLFAHTAGLAVLTALLAVPAGTVVAVLLERGRVPGRAAVRGLVALGLFVPLPVYAVGGQAVLGRWLPPLSLDPGAVAWRPWATGLLPAAVVHAAAAGPWVIWIVSAALRHADAALEEEAEMSGGPAAVRRLVLLPRLLPAMAAAAGWAVVQTVTEIPITDAMMVRTLAEETYTQLVGYPAGVAGAVAVSVPTWLAGVLVAVWVVRPLADRLHPSDAPPAPGKPLFRTGGLAVWAVVLVCGGLPLLALVGQLGDAPGTHLGRVLRLHGVTLLDSGAAAVLAGAVAAGLAVAAGWLARGHRGWSAGLLLLTVAVWLSPGPLVGFGLKELIAGLLDLEEGLLQVLGWSPEFPPLRSALYDQPSPLPGVWAAVCRFFPLAVAIVWPVCRAVPTSLVEAAMLDGAGPMGVWRLVGWPHLRAAAGTAMVAVAVLALGEVSAGKLVTPPHRRAYILELFTQMHYGAEATVAALCLVQVAVTAVVVWGGFRLAADPRTRWGRR